MAKTALKIVYVKDNEYLYGDVNLIKINNINDLPVGCEVYLVLNNVVSRQQYRQKLHSESMDDYRDYQIHFIGHFVRTGNLYKPIMEEIVINSPIKKEDPLEAINF